MPVGVRRGMASDTDYKDFHEAVNMTAEEIGRRIIEILNTKKADLDDDDYAHMRKVNGYVKRHLAQGPTDDVEHSPWRYSLMNWGHDPLKKK